MKSKEGIVIDNIPEGVSTEPLTKGTEKLHEFIQQRKEKVKKNEFSIQLAKGEQVTCPDCGKHIFSNGAFSGCICLGDDMDKKIFITKAESGVKIRFGKGWDQENIELLLELLRRKRE